MAVNIGRESEKWFRDLIKQTAGKKAGENYSKGDRKSINSGAMLFYSYPNPITPLKVLKAFDKYPLIILLEKKGNYFLGVNTHWIPRVMRETFMKLIIKLNKQKIKQDKRISVTYGEIKEFLIRTGLIHVALKKYLVNRIVGLKYIPYKDWKYQLNLPTEKFITTAGVSSSDVDAMIRRAISANKPSKNVRMKSKTVTRKPSSRMKRK